MWIEATVIVIAILAYYIKLYFGLSMAMYIGLVFLLIVMVYQKL